MDKKSVDDSVNLPETLNMHFGVLTRQQAIVSLTPEILLVEQHLGTRLLRA